MAVGVQDGVVVCVLVTALVGVTVDVRVLVGAGDGVGVEDGVFGMLRKMGKSSTILSHTVWESQHSTPPS